MGMRWAVARTNSWLCNSGQLRRSTDRRSGQREGQFCLAVLFIIVPKLIDNPRTLLAREDLLASTQPTQRNPWP